MSGLVSLIKKKPLSSASPQIDRLAFPSLIFAFNRQALHHTLSLLHAVVLILRASVGTDRHSCALMVGQYMFVSRKWCANLWQFYTVCR